MESINLPKSIEVEKYLLGSMLLSKESLIQLMPHLNVDYFYELKHKSIFNAISGMYNKNIIADIITVSQKLSSDNAMQEVGGIYYLSQLTENVTSTYKTESHLAILIELYKKRETFKLLKQTEANCLDNDSVSVEFLPELNQKLINIQELGIINEKSVTEIVLSLNNARDAAQNGELLGYNSGFSELNNTIGGWCKPDMVILAARPGAGKTAMMLSSVYHLAILNKIPTAIFSLEMSSEQLVERLESITSQVPLKRLRMGLMNDYEKKAVLQADDKIIQSPIYIEDTGGISVAQLRAKATILKQKYGIKVIFIDYIQLMTGTNKANQNREQEVSNISRSLKALAKELELPIIALSQLSRRVEERADKLPQLSDLRESGSLEQDADVVIMLMRPAYYEQTLPIEIGGKEYPASDVCIVKVEKNRHGKTSNIALQFIGESMTFQDYPIK